METRQQVIDKATEYKRHFKIEETEREGHDLLSMEPNMQAKILYMHNNTGITMEDVHMLVIAKWMAVIEYHDHHSGHYLLGTAGGSCGFCIRYGKGCHGCPIMKKTGHSSCCETPYYDFSDNQSSETAQRELDFLINLYLENHKE